MKTALLNSQGNQIAMLSKLMRVSLLGVVCMPYSAFAKKNLPQTVASASEIEREAAGPADSRLRFLFCLFQVTIQCAAQRDCRPGASLQNSGLF
jgi:hypothetical protein